MRVACSKHGKSDIDILRKTPQAEASDWLRTVAWQRSVLGHISKHKGPYCLHIIDNLAAANVRWLSLKCTFIHYRYLPNHV